MHLVDDLSDESDYEQANEMSDDGDAEAMFVSLTSCPSCRALMKAATRFCRRSRT